MAAKEATPEVSEEGEIPVDPEEMEVLSKAQEKAVARQPPPRSPVRGPHPEREADLRSHPAMLLHALANVGAVSRGASAAMVMQSFTHFGEDLAL